jgi:predicted enzyme related to lactoylglutathione lyase
MAKPMKRVTGIGGVFFKTPDVQRTKDWYRKHLGFETTDWGATFVWGDLDQSKKTVSRTEWSPFKADTDYYAPSTLPYMINYRVDNLENLMVSLAKEGVKLVGEIQKFEYGKFGWIMDPEGRKLELWEPVDDKFGDDPKAWSGPVTGLGGVFFKSQKPDEMKAWYKEHLGMATEPSDAFQWRDLSNPASKHNGRTVWSPHDAATDYFDPSDKPYMFNYRARDLVKLMKDLEKAGIKSAGEMQVYDEYGKFGWIMDCDGTKVELWEPPG